MTDGLDPELQRFVEISESFAPAETEPSMAQIRAGYNRLCAHFQTARPANLSVENGAVEGPEGDDIPIRIYRPSDVPAPLPTLIYYHGGGWILGDLESHDSITADLAAQAGVQVIAVDYRLAPEHLFPAAFEDSWAVFKAAADAPELFGADPARLVVGGDSAGGNLAAAVALQARDQGIALKGQLLLYPALFPGDLPSRESQAIAPLLSSAEMLDYVRLYLGREEGEVDRHDFRLHPGMAGDVTGLCPAFLTSAELDPLADDAPAYAEKLTAAGVTATAIVEPGLMHGWLRARAMSPRAADAFARIVTVLKGFAE